MNQLTHAQIAKGIEVLKNRLLGLHWENDYEVKRKRMLRKLEYLLNESTRDFR
jgi:hypothetical protein